MSEWQRSAAEYEESLASGSGISSQQSPATARSSTYRHETYQPILRQDADLSCATETASTTKVRMEPEGISHAAG